MTRYIAFLRAINVGGHTVKMDRLRALFQELGLADVRTFMEFGPRVPGTDAHKRAGDWITTEMRLRADTVEIVSAHGGIDLRTDGDAVVRGRTIRLN